MLPTMTSMWIQVCKTRRARKGDAYWCVLQPSKTCSNKETVQQTLSGSFYRHKKPRAKGKGIIHEWLMALFEFYKIKCQWAILLTGLVCTVRVPGGVCMSFSFFFYIVVTYWSAYRITLAQWGRRRRKCMQSVQKSVYPGECICSFLLSGPPLTPWDFVCWTWFLNIISACLCYPEWTVVSSNQGTPNDIPNVLFPLEHTYVRAWGMSFGRTKSISTNGLTVK